MESEGVPDGRREDDRVDRDLLERAQPGDLDAFAIRAWAHVDRLMAIAPDRVPGEDQG